MSVPASPRALVADDEPLLAAELVDLLQAAWPELELLPIAPDGPSALAALEAQQPDFAFLDIRMPGLTGLEVAARLESLPRAPQLVFVTAYDQYALEAFERAAVDYVLKPATAERIARCVARLKQRVAAPAPQPDIAGLLAALAQQQAPRTAPLRWIRAAVGDTVRLIPIDEVIYFGATDKYVAVFTAEGESLIRVPLKDLVPQLDPAHFAQVHRGTVVNLRHVESVTPDGRGHLDLRLRGRPETLTVSRSYTHLFRQM
ncbi:LytTR family DNA-binding domain-containing protein [Niveibacterium sp. SC-1]|uniref:LytR/AlgR family response regulator transcription factor n=1 Tax=Niveibacterium sp. SC-1 TaxID=3135646 RepID=UPI00311D706D